MQQEVFKKINSWNGKNLVQARRVFVNQGVRLLASYNNITITVGINVGKHYSGT
jgi:hypothetical protein